MLVVMESIKFKELAAAVKLLNDSGLVEKPILTIGQTKEMIVKTFVAAVQAIPDDENGDWTGPAEVAEYYEKIVAKEPDPKKKGGDKMTKEKAPKEKKEKVKKEKVEGQESRPKMLARIATAMGAKVTIEKLLVNEELLARYDGHKKWIENDFKKLNEK